MDLIDLEPKYSSKDIPGKCIKCLAEKELNDCLMALLREGGEGKEFQQRFEALASFLKSPDSLRLRDEAEKYLAEGKKVTVKISLDDGKPKYQLTVNND